MTVQKKKPTKKPAKKPAKPAKKPAKLAKKPAKPAKKPAKAPPRRRPKPTAPPPTVADSLARLQRWGGRLDMMPPASDTGARLDAPRPVSGLVRWALPPSYAELLQTCSRLEIDASVIVLSPAEIEYASAQVYLPDESTNDLVPFATVGDDVFCFDISHVRIDGEYSIHRHAASAPSFPTFAAWLAWAVDQFTAR